MIIKKVGAFLAQNWRIIGQWAMLGVMIFVIFHFLVGRLWCYNLVQPFLDYYANSAFTKFGADPVNSTNFDSIIGDLMGNKTRNCTCT